MRKIRINYHNLSTIKRIKPFRLAVASDIHEEISILDELACTVKREKPDVICMPGDIRDNTLVKKYDELIDFINYINIPTIISNGNHEFEAKSKEIKGPYEHVDPAWFEKLRKIDHVYFLEKNFENVIVNGISFSALNLPYSWYNKLKEDRDIAAAMINEMEKDDFSEEYYNVLLSHSPNALLESENLDLILSGHMHAALMPHFLRLKQLKGKGLVGPFMRPLPDRSYGEYYSEKTGTTMIVSSGVTKLSKDSGLSILNSLYKPDIEIIDVEPKSVR